MSHHSADISRLMPLVRHAAAHLGVEQTPTGRKLGLTNGRVVALAVVDATGSCSMSTLGRELGLPSPLATRVADELVARGLAGRHPDHDDRRRVLLRVTGRGRRALAAVRRESEELITAALHGMTELETESLLLGLRAFLRELHEPAAADPPTAVPGLEHASPREKVMKSDA